MAVKRGTARAGGPVALTTLALAFALSGCQETGAPRQASVDPEATAAIRPSGFSPRAATLAVTQMEGPPAPLQGQFMTQFKADVARRDVTLTEARTARYVARGYISAFPVEGGAKLTYVWDIYDRSNHRAQRLNDEIALRGAAADPWSLVDKAALTALAAQSAGEVAAYLSNTPEALTASAQPAPLDTPPAAAGATAQDLPKQALSYAGGR